ncbi:amidohydrolase [Ceratobasidium sp. AG-I]|nr:amidohydrolase [Ceratobasidium sp. AG-I]
MAAKEETGANGCWSGLRALIRTRKPTPSQPLESTKTSDSRSEPPPNYHNLTQATNLGDVYPGSCCGWSTLQHENAVSGPVGELKLPSPEAADTIDREVDELNVSLREVNLQIHNHPELRWDVKYAHDVLTDYLEERGFHITRRYLADHLPGNTAWRGEFTLPSTNGAPLRVIGFNSEMDALPGIGHACGHNLIAIIGVAAALALKRAMEKHKIPGKVVILGTPAEEGGMGKEWLLKSGAYKDMDVCLMAHPGPGAHQAVTTPHTLALQSFTVEYHGQTAHAGASPWDGRNALDAAFIAYAALSALRQQLKPTDRVHGMIEGRDWAPNVIPDYAKMTYFVRALLGMKLWQRAAAHATSCTMTMLDMEHIKDLQQNSALSDDFAAIMTSRHGRIFVPNEEAGASTDFVISLKLSLNLEITYRNLAIPTVPGGANHTAAFTAAARTQEAHESSLAVAKGLATVGLRVLLDTEFYHSASQIFVREAISQSIGIVSIEPESLNPK